MNRANELQDDLAKRPNSTVKRFDLCRPGSSIAGWVHAFSKRHTCPLMLAARLFALLLAFTAGTALAEEQPWLNLLRPDSLVGWDYGPQPSGWSMKEGVLTAEEKSAYLLSGFSVGDFELRVAGTKQPQRSLGISFLKTVSDQEAPHEPGRTVEIHGTLVLKRVGGKLTITSGDDKPYDIDITPNMRYVLGISAQGPATITQLEFREPAGEPIFNGQDLTGWYTPGNKDAWHVDDGAIVKRGGGGNYLKTEKEFGNFTLSLDYKMSKGNNSGIGIRTPKNGWPSSDGMELQLLDKAGTDFGSNMSIYRNVEPLASAHKSEEWNHAVIKADGYMISAWINGELVQQFNTYRHPELKFRNLQGWIGFQDHGGVAEFKNINLLEAPAGSGPAEWTLGLTEPRWTVKHKQHGADLVLDRLMNQEVLTKNDGIRSGMVETSVFSQEEKTLLDLKGPGALVGINVLETGGTLAFYFDDESRPRFAGPTHALRKKLPILSDQETPLVTFVTFTKRLRIKQLSSVGGRYLFEYVTFPNEGVHIETMGDPVENIPRGWLATIDYRHSHYKYGQHRQNDPQPRAGEKNKTIEPGSAVPLLALDGAGIVQWWKLQTNADLLENDDLWLEITVDDEQTPAISAPARYLFAPIADGHKHNNYLFTQSGGFFSRLAMPYGKGLTVLAKNLGDKPIKGVGLEVSYLPAETDAQATDYAGRMRLRGAFLNEQTPTANVAGAGRMVGLIYDNSPQPSDKDSKRGNILTDDQPLAGWKLDSNALLLGMTNDNQNEAESRRVLSGHTTALAWRYFLLAPPEFTKSLELAADQPEVNKLVLYYQAVP